MPDELYRIPPFLRGRALAVVFLIATLVFHWLFVFPWPLTKFGFKPLGRRGWKIVDYIWLATGATALVGTVFSARQFFATQTLSNFDSTLSRGFDVAQQWTDPKTYDGLLCRSFTRTEWSPPEDQLQRVQAEYARKCAWVKAVAVQIKPARLTDIIDVSRLPPAPHDRDGRVDEYITDVLDSVKTHNDIAERRQVLADAQKRSEFEEDMAMLVPLLAVLALALRFTKVTGEIKLS